MHISQKTAIVTGASSGIGAEFSRKLVEKGAKVYGLARREEKLNTIKEKLGDAFIPVSLDITDMDAVSSWIDETFSEDHLPDILINNAGIGYFGNIEDITPEQWHTMMNVNLNGVYYLTRKIVPLMKRNPQVCHILNISSVGGLIGNPKIGAYNTTKFGLRGFSEALFKEVRYDGIKVSCLFPGSIATEFFDNVGAETHANMMQAKDVADVLINVLETPDNFLIDEVTMRPLNPKAPD